MSHADPTGAETPGQREDHYSQFVALLARHDQSIRRFIRTLLPSREGTDDVMQETALECWRKFSEFSPEHPESAAEEFVRWACVIARYKALSWQRDKARERFVFRDDVIRQLAADAITRVDRLEQERQAVESCLEKLSPEHRRLVLSVHAPGESVTRIAAETGQNARRLYTTVNQLRKRLLRCVQQQLTGALHHG